MIKVGYKFSKRIIKYQLEENQRPNAVGDEAPHAPLAPGVPRKRGRRPAQLAILD